MAMVYPYPLRVIVTVAFWPTFGASISTQSPVLMVVIGSLSQAVHGGDLAGNGAADVDPVDLLADDTCRAVMRLLALEEQADGAHGGAEHRRIDHDLARHDLALDVGALHQDLAVLVADVVERPAHPLAIHQGLPRRLAFRSGNASQHYLTCHRYLR